MKPLAQKKAAVAFFLTLFASFVLTGCADIFQFSPFDANASESHLNDKNIQKIQSMHRGADDTLHIIAFTDPHNYYKDLHDAVACINRHSDIDFALIVGDVTEKGLAYEYQSYLNEVTDLRIPYITLIGNHDYRSNGGEIYRKIFGPVNFSFDFQNYRFIGFDNVVWENMNAKPDFQWLSSRAALDDSNKYPVIAAHVLPGSADQSGEVYTPLYEKIMEENRAVLSVHGHVHEFNYYQKNAVPYLIAGSVCYRSLSLIHLYKNTVRIERVYF